MNTTRPATWSRLQKGDWITCPVTGRPERVTYNRPYVNGRRAVRTSSHDHFRPAREAVTVIEKPEWAR